MPISIGRWKLEPNADATAEAFKPIKSGSPEDCGCDPCANFAAARTNAYPGEFRSLLQVLGIPYDRETEMYHNCRLSNGKHSYGGWFHFIGQILMGADAYVPRDETGGTFDLRSMTDSFGYGVSIHTALIPPSFPAEGVLQLEL